MAAAPHAPGAAVRVLSWLGGLVIMVALATSATSLVDSHRASSPHTLSASRVEPAAGAMEAPTLGDLQPRHLIHPSPSPSPSAPPVAARPAAPVARVASPAKPAAVVVRSTQQALINQDRAAHGLAPLTWSSCLYNVAVSNARRIAAQGYLSHTNGPQVDLGCGLGRQAGENIGYWSQGINDGQLNTMFMNSPDHRANILGPYHFVATAWVVAPNGAGYIAVEFG